jgi:alpha-galactosidase
MSASAPAPVSFDAEHGEALLRTPNSVYALRIGADGSPRNVYWGTPLDLAEILERRSSAENSFEGSDPTPDELGIETGSRFRVAGLRVRFADGVRGAQWRFVGAETADGLLRLRMVDRVYPLALELAYRVRPGSDVIERWAEVSHTGDADEPAIVVEHCDSAAWTLPRRGDYRLSHLAGGWPTRRRCNGIG